MYKYFGGHYCQFIPLNIVMSSLALFWLFFKLALSKGSHKLSLLWVPLVHTTLLGHILEDWNSFLKFIRDTVSLLIIL